MADRFEHHSKPEIPPDRFNFISWVLCMAGVLLPLVIVAIFETDREHSVFGYIFGFSLLVAYLSVPYSIYHHQVNHGEPSGCIGQCIFFSMTGVFGVLSTRLSGGVLMVFGKGVLTGLIVSVLLLWYWDLIRWLQTRVMKPYFEVKYAVNTTGLIRR